MREALQPKYMGEQSTNEEILEEMEEQQGER